MTAPTLPETLDALAVRLACAIDLGQYADDAETVEIIRAALAAACEAQRKADAAICDTKADTADKGSRLASEAQVWQVADHQRVRADLWREAADLLRGGEE